MAKSLRWGWCGEGCPLVDETNSWNTAWETDETLTVTTHTVLQVDKDLYVMIVLLVLMAYCLFSFTTTLKRHGTFDCFDIALIYIINAILIWDILIKEPVI